MVAAYTSIAYTEGDEILHHPVINWAVTRATLQPEQVNFAIRYFLSESKSFTNYNIVLYTNINFKVTQEKRIRVQ